MVSKATVIVRRKSDGRILELVEALSLDEFTVANLKQELESRHGEAAKIDLSQVEWARQACG